MLRMVVGIEIQIAIGVCGFSVNRKGDLSIFLSYSLVFVSRKAMEPSFFTSMVN